MSSIKNSDHGTQWARLFLFKKTTWNLSSISLSSNVLLKFYKLDYHKIEVHKLSSFTSVCPTHYLLSLQHVPLSHTLVFLSFHLRIPSFIALLPLSQNFQFHSSITNKNSLSLSLSLSLSCWLKKVESFLTSSVQIFVHYMDDSKCIKVRHNSLIQARCRKQLQS